MEIALVDEWTLPYLKARVEQLEDSKEQK